MEIRFTCYPQMQSLAGRPHTASAGGGPVDAFTPGEAGEAPRPLKPQSRPLWTDVERLGIWSSVLSLTGPLSAAMTAAGVADFKALAGEFDQAGFKFQAISDPNKPRTYGVTDYKPADYVNGVLEYSHSSNMMERMTLTQPLAQPVEDDFFDRKDKNVIQMAKIGTFQDLKDAESIFLAKDFDRLDNPALARRLERLERAGAQFRILEEEGRSGYAVGEAIKNKASRPVGLFGAYRALTRDQKDLQSLWARTGAGTKGMYPAQSEEDLAAIEFFALGESHPNLDRDPLAVRFRDLESVGLSFHLGDDYEAIDGASAFQAVRERGWSGLSISLQGVAKEKLDLNQTGGIPQPSKKLLELAEFHHRVIHSDPALSPEEKSFYARGLTWASADHPLEESLETIRQMRDFEAVLNPSLQGADLTRMGIASYGSLMRAVPKGHKPAQLMGEYQELRRRGVNPEVASRALAHFREKLRPQTFDQAEYREERERILEISEFSRSFEDASEARKVLKMEIAEPYPDRLEAMRHLASVESRHVKENGLSKTSAMKEAMLDYRTLLATPRTSLKSAAELLGSLHDAMVPRVGHEGSREMFDYLQRGITRGVFGPEAVGVFAREFDLAKDLDFARGFLSSRPPIGEPYEVRARAAAVLREGLSRLVPPEKPTFDPDDPFDEKPKKAGRDFPSEAYRLLFAHENRDVEQDAGRLVQLYQRIVPVASFEKAQAMFTELKAGRLGPEADFVPRLEAELALTGDAELTRRGLAGELPGTVADRAALKASLEDPLDFKLLLTEHRQGDRLEDELEVLRMVHRTLVPSVTVEESRSAYSQLMTSLREGPWSGRPLKEATEEFLRSYALKNDLRHALDNLQLAPQGKSGVQEEERQVIIGGVRIRRR